MKKETTLNLPEKLYIKLTETSQAYNIARNILVSSLINYSSKKKQSAALATGLVKYQDRNEDEPWHSIHVWLRQDEHDFFMDLRKVWKLSVSLILAEAIEKYLDELMFKMTRKPDNYRYRNYASSRLIIHGVVCWIFYWGIPPKMLTTPG